MPQNTLRRLSICPEISAKSRKKFNTYRHILKEEPAGGEKVIKALAYQHKRPPVIEVKTELEYLRNDRVRMNCTKHWSHNLPPGSGVVEAACKPPVTQRMK